MTDTVFATGRAWVELDMQNLRRNVAALRSLLPDGCELMPAVKADAYGHGAVAVASELSRCGVQAFCVATVQEGLELRRNGVRGQILILGYTHPRDFSLLASYALTQTVVDCDYATLLDGFGQPLQVHLAVDTGMHRIGERCEHLEQILAMFQQKNLTVTGIYTHLCADDRDAPENRAFTAMQAAAFQTLLGRLRDHGYTPKPHILSSYGLLHYPEYGGAYARVGIALYGVLSSGADIADCGVELRPVLSLKARVASVRQLSPGENAGYGLAYTAEKPIKLAALTIGYADGLPRSLSCGVGSVLLHGRKAPIIGRICMDQTLVDTSEIPGVAPGDVAVLIGSAGGQTIGVCDIAQQADTISNEILSRLGARLERVCMNSTAEKPTVRFSLTTSQACATL